MIVDHSRSGNCWASEVIYSCRKCRTGDPDAPACDVCHEHDEPRGLCSECPICPACDPDAAGLGATF